MRAIPDPGFAGDEGTADPALAAALAAYDRSPDALYLETLAALQGARLLVPVLAEAGETTADMATVLMRGRDGRLAQLAFTCLASLTGWNRRARPVPVPVVQAADAALAAGACALLVDVAGPVRFVVEEQALRSLAEGFTVARVGPGLAWVRTGPG